ncbi:hypothetical protein OIO90_004855 [Microbotryomycetes sp. JL221]|nr:hypothetical protein OIO90_004855 [Microbotryomycetes sp. JL221]
MTSFKRIGRPCHQPPTRNQDIQPHASSYHQLGQPLKQAHDATVIGSNGFIAIRHSCRLAICDGGVGKSSITMAILKREFNDSQDYDPTIEDSYIVYQTVQTGQTVQIELIDTAGQEEYRGLWLQNHVRQADGFILCYSIDNQKSFDQILEYIHMIRKARSQIENPSNESTPENTPFPILLLGNKSDKPPTERCISAQKGLHLTRSIGGLFFECSAKTKINIESSFNLFIEKVFKINQFKIEFLKQEFNYKIKKVDLTKLNREEIEFVGLGFNGNVAVVEKQLQQQQQLRLNGSTGGILSNSTTSPLTTHSPTMTTFVNELNPNSNLNNNLRSTTYPPLIDSNSSPTLSRNTTREIETLSKNKGKKRKQNSNLQLNRKNSMSIGGLGKDPKLYQNDNNSNSFCNCCILS